MKLLLDENLSPRLIASIKDIFPNSAHVERCGLVHTPDEGVWRYAKQHGFVIVTKDSDFFELSALRGCPPKVIWLRIGNCTTTRAGLLLREKYPVIKDFIEERRDCCLMLGVSTQFR